LWCGSHGTLCFLLEATLRLYPAPAAAAVLTTRCADLAEGLSRCHALWRTGVQPVCAVLREAPSGHELVVVLAGREEALASELESARPTLSPVETRTGDDALRARGELRELELTGGGWPPLVIACRPSRLAHALHRLSQVAR